MGIRPWEYLKLTEVDFYLLCIAEQNKNIDESKRLRKLCWTIVCGYADPKKLPANERVWWPLQNDPIIKPVNRRKVLKLHNKFLSKKWQKRD